MNMLIDDNMLKRLMNMLIDDNVKEINEYADRR